VYSTKPNDILIEYCSMQTSFKHFCNHTNENCMKRKHEDAHNTEVLFLFIAGSK